MYPLIHLIDRIAYAFPMEYRATVAISLSSIPVLLIFGVLIVALIKNKKGRISE